jgi:4,5-dihydroxyphthalate decarboxylase
MLRLTLAAGHYDRTEALRDGRVRAEGIDLTYIMLRVEEIFWRMAQHREFDASEFSLGGYVVRRGRGADDLVAIPVFPSRFFRQSCISSTMARASAARRIFAASGSAYPSTR